MIIGSIYRHHHHSINKFNNYLEDVIKKISSENKLMYGYLAGDFNTDILKNNEKYIDDFLDLIYSYSLYPLILRPTRITDKSETLIEPWPWHSAPGVLSSFVSLVWCTDFHTFHGDQRNSCHTMGDKTRQEARSWVLSPALMVSEVSWWRCFFKMSDLIADSGPWYFQVCQGHSALWLPQMPFQLRVLALISDDIQLQIQVAPLGWKSTFLW